VEFQIEKHFCAERLDFRNDHWPDSCEQLQPDLEDAALFGKRGDQGEGGF